jgi:ubiquinone biosynthesis protein COQ4
MSVSRMSSKILRRALNSSANAKLGDPYRLSLLQRAVLVPYFGLGSLMDPRRGDLVAGLGDVTANTASSLTKLAAAMKQTTAGQRLLESKPFLSSANLDPVELREMPPRTLGKEYIDFMDSHHFSADER